MAKTYREKLLDPKWQRRRLEILNAANFTCRDCGASDKTLHVHHARYISDREPWDYPDGLLRCVCVDCHGRHPEADQELEAELGDFSLLLKQLGLRAKYDAAEAVHAVTGLLVQHGDLAALALAHALRELEALDYGLDEGGSVAVIQKLGKASDDLHVASGGKLVVIQSSEEAKV